MVKHYVLIILLLLPYQSQANSSLQIVIDQKKNELGNPIYAKIIAKNIIKNLSALDLMPLHNDFGIEVVESANKNEDDNAIQTLSLKLYPRQSGTLTIPRLYLNKHETSPIELTVYPAMDASGVIDFETTYSSKSVWQRQQVIINITIISPAKFARIELGDFTQPGMESVKIEATQTKTNEGNFKLSTGWKVYPQLSGQHILSPPAINYWLNGKIQRKFFPTTQPIRVQSLPAYVPPFMPVGVLKVQSRLSHDNTWVVDFSSRDISPKSMSLLSVPHRKVPNEKFGETTITKHAKNRLSHSIPLQLTHSQFISLPSLTYRSFNPYTERLGTYRTNKHNSIYLTSWLKALLAIAAILIMLKLFIVSFNIINKIVKYKHSKRAIIRSIPAATTPSELHSILMRYAELEKWGSNLSLNQWAHAWSKAHHSCPKDLIQHLSLACYSAHKQHSDQVILNRKACELITL